MAEAPDRVREIQRLFLHHADVLEGFILAIHPDFSVSKDLVHEVFLTLSSKAAEFRPGSDFLAWARAVARLKVLEHLRRRKCVPRPLGPDVLEAVIADAAEAEESWADRRQALADCLRQLAPRAREILELRYSGATLSPREIAGRVSWTSGAVRVALARARRFLQECTERRLAGQEA
jgi:RNA polymerase sigma-70 factor (ECF subfamily)